jgi:RHS repeat-associated protein
MDGNGNVAALVNADTGAVSAEYEYGPFGEPLRATGTIAKANPFRFSTKYFDVETGLENWGYRYGRIDIGWLSRDPLGDMAFLRQYLPAVPLSQWKQVVNASFDSPYLFVGNDAINAIDCFGLTKECPCKSGKWVGTVNWKITSLILGFGEFSGWVNCTSDRLLGAKVAGHANSAGISLGVSDGNQQVVFGGAETASQLVGKTTGFLVFDVGAGVGPLNLGSAAASAGPGSGVWDLDFLVQHLAEMLRELLTSQSLKLGLVWVGVERLLA